VLENNADDYYDTLLLTFQAVADSVLDIQTGNQVVGLLEIGMY